MNIRFQTVNFDADQDLIDFVQRKVDKLETFYDRIVDSEVYLKHNNKDGNANYVSEVKLFVPGATLFASEEAESFEAATDQAVENMRKQLLKYKDKLSTNRPNIGS